MAFQGFQSFNQFTVPSCFAGFLKIVIFILLTTRHHYWIFQTEAIIKTNGYSKFDDLWLLILADMVQNVIIIISLSHGYTWTKLIDFCSFILELLYFKWKKKKKIWTDGHSDVCAWNISFDGHLDGHTSRWTTKIDNGSGTHQPAGA